jgi:hypothetical protein
VLHPDGDDIAAIPLELDSSRVRWHSIGVPDFLTPEIMDSYFIGPGDETYMIGRLVTLDGRQRNTPVVRYGNVSMSPNEPIRLEGRDHEAFLIECRSLSGFSGSPVFVIAADRAFDALTLPKELRQSQNDSTIMKLVRGTWGPWLLGIDFAHVPLWKPVYESDHETATSNWVDANTGMA